MINEYKMVIVARRDLKLSPGKFAAQVAHAAVACAVETKKSHPKWFQKWMESGGKKAIVETESVFDFENLEYKAKSLDICAIIISDAGYTEIPMGTKTVLGIGPAPSNLIDQVTGELSLL